MKVYRRAPILSRMVTIHVQFMYNSYTDCGFLNVRPDEWRLVPPASPKLLRSSGICSKAIYIIG
jgi:hypothetical protein